MELDGGDDTDFTGDAFGTGFAPGSTSPGSTNNLIPQFVSFDQGWQVSSGGPEGAVVDAGDDIHWEIMWVAGLGDLNPDEGPTSPATPQVKKHFSLTTPCAASAEKLMGAVENNFSRFGNYSAGPFGVTFTPPSGMNVGSVIPINIGTMGHHQNLSVTVQSMNSQSLTFTTNPGHLLYPASITFSASTGSGNSINFNIDLSGNFPNLFRHLEFDIGGGLFENAQWKNFLAQVKAFCDKGH